MTRTEAHARLALMDDRSWLTGADGIGDWFPAVATALADLSGWLDDATTDAELREAALHGDALYSSGVITDADLDTAAEAVVLEVMRSVEAQGLHRHPHQEATCSDS